jgi:AmmeMemoRadiSam system protein A
MMSIGNSRSLDDEERSFLLDLARATIEARLSNRPLPHPKPWEGPLLEARGAFVTLKVNGTLRGCIGHVVGVMPLWEAVRENALAAAFRDPRFPPLSLEELDQVLIEISALTPLRTARPEDIEVGRDGVLIEHGASRGLLLPQVATEYGWSREEFLDSTCRKAGLPAGSWKRSGTVISVFSAEVFGEDEPAE